MFKLRKYLIILLSIASPFLVNAQEESLLSYSKFPLKLAIGNHAVGFLYQNSFDALNPHVSLGTEFGLNKNQKHQLFASSNIGFFKNLVIGSTMAVDLNLGYRFTHKIGLFLETELGLGFLNQYHPRAIYVQNSEDGSYEKTTDKGTLASSIGFKTGIGYDFSKNAKTPFRLGINHNFFLQTSYFDVASFPIMPQSTTNLTLTYKFQK